MYATKRRTRTLTVTVTKEEPMTEAELRAWAAAYVRAVVERYKREQGDDPQERKGTA